MNRKTGGKDSNMLSKLHFGKYFHKMKKSLTTVIVIQWYIYAD